MSVNGVGNNSQINRIVSQPIQKQITTEGVKQLPATDRLELSGVSDLFKTLKSNDVRTEKVADIKSRIEAGTYEDDKKLDAAVDRLLDELNL